MSVATKWDTREYQRIATVERGGETLIVSFEDGSRVRVDPRRLLPASSTVHWDALTANPYEIVVPSADGPVEISWASIRALTDRDYAAHLAAAAEEQARMVGSRIKELRQRRGLSGKELAERAGIAPQSLSRIEHGRHDVVFTTLRRILAAMGCSLRDVVEVDTRPAVGSVRGAFGGVEPGGEEGEGGDGVDEAARDPH
jgi:transcriptional regulator with XRE-family HTH domain